MTFTYMEVTSALVTQLLLIYFFNQYKDMCYNELKQKAFKWYSITAISLVLSTVFHPGKKGSFFFTLQMFVSFTMFVEALALVP